MPGSRGWSWVAVLARARRAKFATVAETALLPGDDALLAPEWEPWSERLKPEDIGADDMLPYKGYDERLVPGTEALVIALVARQIVGADVVRRRTLGPGRRLGGQARGSAGQTPGERRVGSGDRRVR